MNKVDSGRELSRSVLTAPGGPGGPGGPAGEKSGCEEGASGEGVSNLDGGDEVMNEPGSGREG